jgi:hypothetical protein
VNSRLIGNALRKATSMCRALFLCVDERHQLRKFGFVTYNPKPLNCASVPTQMRRL